MDVLTLAKQREQAMEQLYTRLAQRTSNESIRGLLFYLADMEGAHGGMVDDISRDNLDLISETVTVDDTLMLREIDLRKDFLELDISQLELYRKVREYEVESQKFYETLAARATNPKTKKVLKEFAEEERGHVVEIENIIEMIELPEVLHVDAEFGRTKFG